MTPGVWHPRHLARALGRAARRPGWALAVIRRRLFPIRALSHDPEAYQHVASWTFGEAPRRELAELVPGVEGADVSLARAFDRDPQLSLNASELLALAALVRVLAPERVLEIGTAQGHATLNIALNAPRARIVTVDLPPEEGADLQAHLPPWMKNAVGKAVGRQFRDTLHAARIEQRLCDSYRLDWSTLPGPFDLILVDGCHHYPYVQRDTAQALDNLASGGCILWHDYGMIEDVSRAVDEIGDRIPLHAIRGTRFAVAFRDG